MCCGAGDWCGLMVLVLLARRFVFAWVGGFAAGAAISCGLMVIVLLALRFVFAGVGDCAAGVGIGMGGERDAARQQ